MTSEQRDLIERSLKIIGRLSLGGLALLVVFGMFEAATSSKFDIGDLIRVLLDWDDVGIMTYPLAAIGILALWTRRFLQAGRQSAEHSSDSEEMGQSPERAES